MEPRRGLGDPRCHSLPPSHEAEGTRKRGMGYAGTLASRPNTRHQECPGPPGLESPWLASAVEGQRAPGTSTPGSFAFPPTHSHISLPPTCHSPINVKVEVTAGLCAQSIKSLFYWAASRPPVLWLSKSYFIQGFTSSPL